MSLETRLFATPPADREFVARALADPGFGSNYAEAGSLQAIRAGTAAITGLRFVRQPLPAVAVAPERIAGIPCERLTPPAAHARGLIVYLHGGGFIRGSLDLGRANASMVAAAAGLPVVAVGYRQAPEHPYPAAPQDVLAVVETLRAAGQPLAVVGESSGGCLALGLVAQLADSPRQLPAGIAALSPMCDLTLRGASWLYNAEHDVADLATGRRMVSLYLGAHPADDPLVSPARHHFRGSCPLLLAIGSHETMLSDTEQLALKAADAGVAVRLDVHQAMPHGFTRFAMPAATRALEEAGRWCRARIDAAA
ncbi:MAG TPA: alpha/beta hydrolase fold domain-containing protein [Ramlibacter sp.]|nr:alpha/beta hydrolase fold domain-containing protein [Ramlibacter sp.]